MITSSSINEEEDNFIKEDEKVSQVSIAFEIITYSIPSMLSMFAGTS